MGDRDRGRDNRDDRRDGDRGRDGDRSRDNRDRRDDRGDRDRDRDRSGGGGGYDDRGRGGHYRDDWDNTPDLSLNARVFVGSLHPDAGQTDVRENFLKYGNVTKVTILRGYGFVQFEEEEAAQRAIAEESGKQFFGKSIEVKPAKRNTGDKSNEEGGPSGRGDGGDRGRGGYRGRGGWDPSRGRGGPPMMMRGRGGPPRGRGGYGGHYDGGYDDGYGYGGRGGHHGGGYRGGHNDYGPPPGGPPSSMVKDRESDRPANDCEIVCMNKQLRHYAETIEFRLKNLGLKTDVLFPNPEIPLAKILSNIAGRGVVYACLLTPLNEEHLTLTLNILQGQQQEHRNMPLEDAIGMIAKHFERYIDATGGISGPMGQGGMADSHPEDIKTVLGFLSDNRPLSVMEYDKMIKYLAQSRGRMLKMEYGSDIPAHLVDPPIGPAMDPALKAKQGEVRNKIMAILSKQKSDPPPKPVEPEKPPVEKNTTGIQLDNNSLQKAIDNLIKSGGGGSLLAAAAAVSNQQAAVQPQAAAAAAALIQPQAVVSQVKPALGGISVAMSGVSSGNYSVNTAVSSAPSGNNGMSSNPGSSIGGSNLGNSNIGAGNLGGSNIGGSSLPPPPPPPGQPPLPQTSQHQPPPLPWAAGGNVRPPPPPPSQPQLQQQQQSWANAASQLNQHGFGGSGGGGGQNNSGPPFGGHNSFMGGGGGGYGGGPSGVPGGYGQQAPWAGGPGGGGPPPMNQGYGNRFPRMPQQGQFGGGGGYGGRY